MPWGSDYEETTEFNSNIATLQRIDDLLKACREASINEELEAWFKYLQVLRRESLVKMKDTKKDQSKVEEKKLYKELKKKYRLFSNHSHKQDVRFNFEDSLEEFEIFHREYMDKKGMLLKNQKDLRGL